MAKTVSPGAISSIMSNPNPDSSAVLPEIVVQVLDLKPLGNRYTFNASDGKSKLKAILQSSFSSEVVNGNIQSLGLVRVTDYTLNDIPNKNEKYLIVTKCEAVSPPLEAEYKVEVKSENAGIVLKPKQEVITKSAAQIIHEQNRNVAPAARMSMTRRVHPLASLNPYQGNWTIKVRLTAKGTMRHYKNARGEGCVFNVELTDEDGTQIQATMFNEAARKFFDMFEMGKVYYISKGSLKVANKQFKTVQNDYEMTLNENSLVEEAVNEAAFIPETKFNFIPIDQLGPYVQQKELIDVIGVVQNVSPTMSIRRKIDNETVPKRDITIADDTKKTVVVSLWGGLATDLGQKLLDMADDSPVVAIKSLRVSDFQGVSLSTVSKSIVEINPDSPDSQKLKSWYSSEGKETSMQSLGSTLSPSMKSGGRSLYADRVTLDHITSNPSLGEDKPVFYSARACMSLIKTDQTMYYRACKTCNKKVTEELGSGYWCQACQKTESDCSLRYILSAKFSDASGGAWFSLFSDEAEKIIGCPADELDNMKSQDDVSDYQTQLKKATWVPHVFRLMVAPREYNNEKRQRITVKSVNPVDFAAESKLLLQEISSMKA
ncbi:putative replication factor A protein [Helianthus annuus]|uniref:Replication protein A subunit n=1 Tax=Helianthus annuus TaxID=4232 RepID=A0A251S0S4_HELAN|nr:replication protein A 70 kDa DNA-binding subunit B [Helianthus annuus]KAF5809348.1 putative replication factor A protein [Helianthus annuus]KAJ0587870.1 putative replication factor A protein [Helianthus annuus]KAJ0596306.1 putative replication factor A protein [Helianthus annuus]KAJ0756964.1 putative replication factor A protein [Helianthus annuus]KAJ0760697.1 putative replication factor A protein [Helianthus annuus]